MHKFILYILCELVYCVVQTGYRKPCKCAMLVSQLQYCESPLYGQAGQRYELLGTYYSHITVFLMFPGSLRYIYHTCSAHILYSMPSCANYRFLQKLWSHVWLLSPLTNCPHFLFGIPKPDQRTIHWVFTGFWKCLFL